MIIKDAYFRDSAIRALYYDEDNKKAVVEYDANYHITISCTFEEFKTALNQTESFSF
jgi:hypothetical protein